ncbi:MAG: helix-turn-helix domain-containing protein [Methanobrevibacter sp.]|nr:helix-turn-helix domain-containing protein [Methanobrevibacter sp.]
MNKPTQKDRVVAYINEFGSITTWQAYADLGITRLSARIWELKEKGYIFKKDRVKRMNRYNQPVSFDKYMIVGNINEVANA